MRSIRTAVMALGLVGLVGFVGAGAVQAQRESQRRGKQRPGISLQLATGVAHDGFQQVQVEGADTLYLVPGGAISTREVLSTADSGGDVALTLTPQAAARLGSLMSSHGADQMVVFIEGRPEGVASVSLDAATGSATLSGLTTVPVDELTQMIRRPVVPVGPRLEVLPRNLALQPGQAVTVEVYVRDVADVRGYQLDLDVVGGLTGQITVEDVAINEQHPQYLFSGLQSIQAVDKSDGRMLGVLWNGTVAAQDAPAYLGSFTLRASTDATGIFSATLRGPNDESFLLNPQTALVPVAGVSPATITVGVPGVRTPENHE